MTVHSVAQLGFNTATEHYDRSRPSYQPVALSYIRRAVESPQQINVVERVLPFTLIGAGSGLFTKAFIAHPEWKDAFKELKAIEPSPGMRTVFTQTLSDERVSINEGTFDHTGIADGWADLVVIAQAFHWSPDFDQSAKEIGRILKPGGVLALIWNLEDRETAQWVAQVRDTIEKFEQGTPQYRHGLWRRVFQTEGYRASFEPPQEKTWSYALQATKDTVLDRAFSKSYMTLLSDEKKAQTRADLSAVIDKGKGRVWVNEDEGIFEYPYKTDVVIARRRA
ncbi:S-adenosyl-L-methionine-dependent methyltransferase [Mycena indigotica]|uniref:S-adenosyl-L-methionine-dependent methyltransferase n=1 Tax=Mycena indigotica TaxID=2126181 RepID=A0A8H6RZM6_9AGAR|nr:S-adenosyl-L-methionine-dependent methyltransferase [Mycena indigotica]KAF7289941.1 S-adenosyl-L-methionine-dependent methyltransferase [Mycena indigotica]